MNPSPFRPPKTKRGRFASKTREEWANSLLQQGYPFRFLAVNLPQAPQKPPLVWDRRGKEVSPDLCAVGGAIRAMALPEFLGVVETTARLVRKGNAVIARLQALQMQASAWNVALWVLVPLVSLGRAEGLARDAGVCVDGWWVISKKRAVLVA